MNFNFHLIYRLPIAKYEIYCTFNVAFMEVMAPLVVPQGILDPKKGTFIESSFVPKDSSSHSLYNTNNVWGNWMVVCVLLRVG